nr:MAG TPA: hypothetical protein [Caudoviricetes sp.]
MPYMAYNKDVRRGNGRSPESEDRNQNHRNNNPNKREKPRT